MTRAPSIMLLLAVVISSPACISLGCAAVLARQGASVSLPYSGTLPAGDYTIEVHAEGVDVILAETIDATGKPASSDYMKNVTLADGSWIAVRGDLYPGASKVDVYNLRGGPAELTVDVYEGTRSIGHADLTPSYHDADLVGDGCQISTIADETVPITP